MTLNNLDSLEDRIEKPSYLLFLVLVLLLLIVGLVDLIDYVAEFPVILNRYTPSYFVVMIGYTIFTLFWSYLLFKPNDDRLFNRALDFLQMRPVLAVGVLAVMGLMVVIMINAGNTIEGAMLTLPAFQVTMLAILLLFSGIILFYKWGDKSRPQRWRKIILAALGIVLLIEIVLQALAFFGTYPRDLSTTQSFDSYSPYNRIYYSEEGFSNGLTNNYGRYAPDFELLPDSNRIVVLGDSFVEGLQVGKDENFSTLLEERIVADSTKELLSEVLALGYPDLGPGIYLSEWLTAAMVDKIDPDEAIIFFDLGNDFQTVDRVGTGYPYFVYESEGKAELDKSRQYRDIHMAEHYVFRGYKGIQPVLILRSNFLTPRLIWDNVIENDKESDNPDGRENEPANDEIDLPNGFVFNAQTNKEALQIAAAQISMVNEALRQTDTSVKLVTNPVFTKAFFEQELWNTLFGDSDLLLPEKQLRDSAQQQGIPFLGLGIYMEAQGLSPADVQELYFDDGLGHFTPVGHEFVAEAIYQCFYAKTLSVEDGCDLH